jgi:hypothetical protein
MLPPKTQLETTAEINHSYIIFVWRELEEEEDITDILRTQLNQIQYDELLQWNPRGRFVVVVTDQDSSSRMSEAFKIYEIMWMEYKAVNTVVLVPGSSGNYTVLDLYSGFPYQIGNCEKVQEITLVDQWVLENNGTFSENTNLYPSKIPNNFQQCVITAASIGFHPFVSLISAEKKEDGNTLYDVRGLAVEYFLLSTRKMNLTVVFLQPSLDISFEAGVSEATKLMAGIADVVVGIVPLMPIVVTGMSEPSIPYLSDAVKWFVPCPKPISRVEKFLTVFDATVWLTMIIVFILTSTLFWFSANYPDRIVEIESKNFQTIPKCMYNAWSIFIAVSVQEMPRSWRVRISFLIYVCYCFVISTVFQAFFVSYLVEPGYGEKISTFQELLDSSVNYGFNAIAEFGMRTMEFSDHWQFPPTRRVDCADLKSCLIRMMTERDVATICAPLYAKYLSNEFGHQFPCSLDENFLYGSTVAVFTKGNPLVKQFNRLIRRCVEGGLGERYWAQLNHEALLRSKTKSDKDVSSMYFVFTLSHMVPAFSVLGLGFVCSTVVCIAECLHNRFSK